MRRKRSRRNYSFGHDRHHQDSQEEPRIVDLIRFHYNFTFLPACSASATLVSGRHLFSFLGIKSFFEEQDGEMDTGTYVIEVTELISEVRSDLLGH